MLKQYQKTLDDVLARGSRTHTHDFSELTLVVGKDESATTYRVTCHWYSPPVIYFSEYNDGELTGCELHGADYDRAYHAIVASPARTVQIEVTP